MSISVYSTDHRLHAGSDETDKTLCGRSALFVISDQTVIRIEELIFFIVLIRT